MRCLTVAALVLCASAPALAQTEVAGKTGFTFYSGALGDWAAPNAKDAKIAMTITGDAAKRIYDFLGTKSERRECAAEGEHLRMRGDISCLRDVKGAVSCDLGIDLTSGKSILGSVC